MLLEWVAQNFELIKSSDLSGARDTKSRMQIYLLRNIGNIALLLSHAVASFRALQVSFPLEKKSGMPSMDIVLG